MKTKFEFWLEKVNKERETYWNNNFSYKPYESLDEILRLLQNYA